jgi:hypothetical protein
MNYYMEAGSLRPRRGAPVVVAESMQCSFTAIVMAAILEEPHCTLWR